MISHLKGYSYNTGYVNCLDLLDMLTRDNPITPRIHFHSNGFNGNSDILALMGWLARCRYNLYTKKYNIRFYHPDSQLTFIIKTDSIQNLNEATFDINICPAKKAKFELIEKDFVKRDIPELLELITSLQKPTRLKQISKMEIPEAEILLFKKWKGLK